MRKLNVIGIGAGDPDYLTIQAVKALNRTNVFFFSDKGDDKEDLLRLRREICERNITHDRYRIVAMEDPQRDAADPDYGHAVHAWHDQRARLWEEKLRGELADGQTGAFLAWGDPTLYDSTLRILETIRSRGALQFELEVIPGISALQALTARHQIPLVGIGGSLAVTTGRGLAQGWPTGADDVVVMLDAHCTFRNLEAEDASIFWGAYLGTDEELLIAGTIGECGAAIADVRAAARARRGWIFDTYLLRRAR